MLREIVDDGVNGHLCDGSPDGLFTALHRLASDRAHARVLGRAAREKAVRLFSLESQARAVLAVYRELLGSGD
jgi:glycosyltransferase involved in cell wall biosynthesis